MALTVMLCGANDTEDCVVPLRRIVESFGGNVMSFIDGTTLHRNIGDGRGSAEWTDNSKRSVGHADLCILVVNAAYGHITWLHELQRIMESGRPFLILAAAKTLTEYRVLLETTGAFHSVRDDSKRLLYGMIQVAEKRGFTLVPFTMPSFEQNARLALGNLFVEGLTSLAETTKLIRSLHDLDRELTATRASEDNAKRSADSNARSVHSARLRIKQLESTLQSQAEDFERMRARMTDLGRENLGLTEGHQRSLTVIILTMAIVLVLGGLLGALIFRAVNPGQATTPGSAAPSTSSPATSPAADPYPSPGPDEYVPMPCTSGTWVAFVGQYEPDRARVALTRQRILLPDRAATVSESKPGLSAPAAKLSLGSTCRSLAGAAYKHDGSVDRNSYLWFGPFAGQDAAEAACASYDYGTDLCFASHVR